MYFVYIRKPGILMLSHILCIRIRMYLLQHCFNTAIHFSFCSSFSTSLNLVLVQVEIFILARTRSIIFSIVSVVVFTSAFN